MSNSYKLSKLLQKINKVLTYTLNILLLHLFLNLWYKYLNTMMYFCITAWLWYIILIYIECMRSFYNKYRKKTSPIIIKKGQWRFFFNGISVKKLTSNKKKKHDIGILCKATPVASKNMLERSLMVGTSNNKVNFHKSTICAYHLFYFLSDNCTLICNKDFFSQIHFWVKNVIYLESFLICSSFLIN